MSLPDFLIVGAMKCGTTTLSAQLAAQSGVFMTDPKEPNFFSNDEVWSLGEGWYRALFAGAGSQDLKGEASTHYTKLPTYPETLSRLGTVLEQPKIIYMIRNPVTRAVSHYIHGWSRGEMGRDPVKAFAQHPEVIDYGRYGMQITPFIERFGSQDVLLTSLEQLVKAPQEEFARISSFLGRPMEWCENLEAQNVSAQRSRKLPFHRILVDNPVAETLRRTLVPKSVRTRLRLGRRMTERPTLPDSLRRDIEKTFAQDRATLAGHFPGHPALDLCYPFLQ